MVLQYASPEQINADYFYASPLFDSYAAGIVLYQMITGELPFKRNDN
jgi:serine/threonine protein kinase